MKKSVAILMVIAMAFMVPSCGLKDSDDVQNPRDIEYEDDAKDTFPAGTDDEEEPQHDANQFATFYTKTFEESFTSIYDDPEGKIVFCYPKEMEQIDDSLTCIDPFLTIHVDHGVKNYGEGLEDAKVFLESVCGQVDSATIGGKEAVKSIYEGEQSAGGEYVVFVGGEVHDFMTISFAVMPGYAEAYAKLVDKMLAGLEFLP